MSHWPNPVSESASKKAEVKNRCLPLPSKNKLAHDKRRDRIGAAHRPALKCGFQERFAQQALGNNSKAVHHACSKHADLTRTKEITIRQVLSHTSGCQDWSLGQKQLLVEPRSDIVDRLDSLEIKVIWREKKVFLDNVNGQFT